MKADSTPEEKGPVYREASMGSIDGGWASDNGDCGCDGDNPPGITEAMIEDFAVALMFYVPVQKGPDKETEAENARLAAARIVKVLRENFGVFGPDRLSVFAAEPGGFTLEQWTAAHTRYEAFQASK